MKRAAVKKSFVLWTLAFRAKCPTEIRLPVVVMSPCKATTQNRGPRLLPSYSANSAHPRSEPKKQEHL